MPKTLYVAEFSVWAAATELAVLELGYPKGKVMLKTVNLVEGENFEPAFLNVNPNGTVPTLEVDGKVYPTTAEITAYLVQHAPVKVKVGTPAIIEAVHDERYDPNFSMLVARDHAELAAKAAGLQGSFLAARQVALEKYAADPATAAFHAFYQPRLKGNAGLLALFKREVPAEVQADWFSKSRAHWASVRSAVFEVYAALLPASGFIGGEIPGEDDFHMIAWFTRIAWIVGARSGADGLAAFESAYGAPVPEAVAAYWKNWVARASWKKVYAVTLH
ncbi:hypothetical protein DFH07DRAFT_833307 [Mycena maculata]|uniref:GST N-terminal domain-containing protein n=1 Tax=Mycena maculata TaxID=230809 RepID=A0AAD7ILE5_9AGAR|nr:hypothetical protein DFH07DRAFT_833307 [Mycena maculata]